MQSLLLILAPALFAASIYMAFGRIVILVHGEESCLVRRTWLTKIFVTGDVASFFIQGIGKSSHLFVSTPLRLLTSPFSIEDKKRRKKTQKALTHKPKQAAASCLAAHPSSSPTAPISSSAV